MAHDARTMGDALVRGGTLRKPFQLLDEESAQRAQTEVILEMDSDVSRSAFGAAFEREWIRAHEINTTIPGLAGYGEDELDEAQLLIERFDNIQGTIAASADRGSSLEKKLAKHHGGYAQRAKHLRARIMEASEFLLQNRTLITKMHQAQVAEHASAQERLERLRDEVTLVSRREREAQEDYRVLKDELAAP